MPPCFGPGDDKIHELVRVRHGQLAQQHLIVDREDRRVDAEPERERRDDDDGEQRPPREAAQAVANVAQQIPHHPLSLFS